MTALDEGVEVEVLEDVEDDFARKSIEGTVVTRNSLLLFPGIIQSLELEKVPVKVFSPTMLRASQRQGNTDDRQGAAKVIVKKGFVQNYEVKPIKELIKLVNIRNLFTSQRYFLSYFVRRWNV